MTASRRATFAQIADLARSLQRMRKPRERVAISRRLLALAVSLGDTEKKCPAAAEGHPAKPVGPHPMDEEEALKRPDMTEIARGIAARHRDEFDLLKRAEEEQGGEGAMSIRERVITHTVRHPVAVTRDACRRYQAHATVFTDKGIHATGDTEQAALFGLLRIVSPPLFSDGGIAPPRRREYDGPLIHWYIGTENGAHALIREQWEYPPTENVAKPTHAGRSRDKENEMST